MGQSKLRKMASKTFDIVDINDVDPPKEEPLVITEEGATDGGFEAKKSNLEKSQGKKRFMTVTKMGVIFAAFAGSCFLASNMFIKYASLASPPQMLIIWMILQTTVSLIIKSSTFGPLNVSTMLKLFAVALVDGTFFLAQILAVKVLPLGDWQPSQ